MEKLAEAFNKAFSEAGIKTLNDFKKVKVDLEAEERNFKNGLEGLSSIFMAWVTALDLKAEQLEEIESLMMQDPFLIKFPRVSSDRINKMLVINHDGEVFHIFEKDGVLKLVLDVP